jgi:hypothetical protein
MCKKGQGTRALISRISSMDTTTFSQGLPHSSFYQYRRGSWYAITRILSNIIITRNPKYPSMLLSHSHPLRGSFEQHILYDETR